MLVHSKGPMKVLETSPATWMRNALLANAAFSLISALCFFFVPNVFAAWVGIGSVGFVSLGINLFVFALILAGLATRWALRSNWALIGVATVIVMDIAWVAGSFFLVALPSMTTDAGRIFVLSIAVVVGLFALLQSYALIRLGFARRKSRRTAGSALLVAIVLPTLVGCSMADVRTAPLRDAAPESELIDKGRSLLQRVADTHGLAIWRTYTTQEVIMTDAWQAASWWPESEQKISLKTLPGTFTGKVTFLEGSSAGTEWGIQSWRAYRRDPTGRLSFEPAQEEPTAQTFYLPSLQYFNELPFRLLKATHIAYAGEREYRGKIYDLIFASWGSFEPNPDHDQYLLWIDRSTMLVAMCQYTLRDAAPAFTGTIHFEDYRDLNGVQFPFKQTVILPAPENTLYPLDEYFFHQSRVESVSFDAFDRAELIVDASLEPGDAKQ